MMKNRYSLAMILRYTVTGTAIIVGIATLVRIQISGEDALNIDHTILLLVTLLATAELVERALNFDVITNKIDLLTAKLDSGLPEVYAFQTPEEGYSYLVRRLKSSDTTIDHASLSPSPPGWFPERRAFEEARYKVLEGSRIQYRYIFDEARESKLDEVRRWLASPAIHRFFPASFRDSDSSHPGVNFMIFDDRFLALYLPATTGEPERLVTTSDSVLVSSFRRYFNLLWTRASYLQDSKISPAARDQRRLP